MDVAEHDNQWVGRGIVQLKSGGKYGERKGQTKMGQQQNAR